MSSRASNRAALGASREDWGRVRKALAYAEAALGGRFNGNGHVRGAEKRGWMRRRLREHLESFPAAEDAQTWVRAACFKALRKGEQPMAYFASLVKAASDDERMRKLLGLLTVDEYREFRLSDAREHGPGVPGRGRA